MANSIREFDTHELCFFLMRVEPKELTIKGLVWVVIGTVYISQAMITVLQ